MSKNQRPIETRLAPLNCLSYQCLGVQNLSESGPTEVSISPTKPALSSTQSRLSTNLSQIISDPTSPLKLSSEISPSHRRRKRPRACSTVENPAYAADRSLLDWLSQSDEPSPKIPRLADYRTHGSQMKATSLTWGSTSGNRLIDLRCSSSLRIGQSSSNPVRRSPRIKPLSDINHPPSSPQIGRQDHSRSVQQKPLDKPSTRTFPCPSRTQKVLPSLGVRTRAVRKAVEVLGGQFRKLDDEVQRRLRPRRAKQKARDKKAADQTSGAWGPRGRCPVAEDRDLREDALEVVKRVSKEVAG